MLSRPLAADETVTIPLNVGGTATRGTDYRLVCIESRPAGAATCNGIGGASPSFTFHGEHLKGSRRSTGPLRIETIKDNATESNETVTLSLGGANVLTLTLTEAPSSVVLSFAKATVEVPEADGLAEPVLRVDTRPGSDITVPLVFTDITATKYKDYTPTPTFTFEADGTTTDSLDVPIQNDGLCEGDETFRITINESRLPTGVTVGEHGSMVVTMKDYNPAETRVTSITRDFPSTSTATTTGTDTRLIWEVTFNEAVQNVDAGDFTISGTTATLTVERVPSTNAYYVTASGGNLANLDGTVTLSFANGHNIQDCGGQALTQTAPTETNEPDFEVRTSPPELPVVTVSAGASSVTEGENVEFTVRRTGSTEEALLATVRLTENSNDGQDFVAAGFEGDVLVAILPGSAMATHTVPTVDDPTDEPNGQVTLAVLDSSDVNENSVNYSVNYSKGAPSSASVTVNDNDDGSVDTTAPRVTSITRQSPSSSPTAEDTLTWRVTFSEAVQNVDPGDFNISGTTGATLAVAPVSTTVYDVTASGGDLASLDGTVTLSFAPGQNIEDTSGNALTNITPTGTNDDTFVVSNLSNYSLSPLEIYEGERLTFTIVGFGSNYNLAARINTSTSTASSSDYNLYTVGGQSSTAYAVIPQGSTRQFDIEATTDSDGSEGDETIVVEFGQNGGGYFTGGTVRETFTVTLKDGARPDMSTGGVTISPTSLALTELGSSSAVEKTYTVVLNTDPTADVTVTVANGDASAVAVDTDTGMSGNQNTLTFTHGNSGNWNTAQTVTVRALNDPDGANESFSLTHSATATGSTAPYHNITIDPVAITTTDAGHGVVVSKSSVSVAENDETATYTVVLKSQPGGTVTITPTSGATTTATVSPASVSFTNSDWNTPKTFTVTGKGAGSTSIPTRIGTRRRPSR